MKRLLFFALFILFTMCSSRWNEPQITSTLWGLKLRESSEESVCKLLDKKGIRYEKVRDINIIIDGVKLSVIEATDSKSDSFIFFGGKEWRVCEFIFANQKLQAYIFAEVHVDRELSPTQISALVGAHYEDMKNALNAKYPKCKKSDAFSYESAIENRFWGLKAMFQEISRYSDGYTDIALLEHIGEDDDIAIIYLNHNWLEESKNEQSSEL